ncbi:MAG: phosphotransferase family protein, partial [Desulfococcaceae bacterium]
DGILADVSGPEVRAPRPLDLDRDAHVLVMEDVGQAPSLAEAIPNLPSPAQIGATLGGFIGRLHRQSLDHPQVAADFRNQAIQETRLAVQYRGVRDLLRNAEILDADALGDRAESLGHRLLQPGRCLVMGDLWPPSIRIGPDGIRLIDWEFAHFGNSAQDLAHLDAHLWMTAHRATDLATRTKIETVRNHFFTAYETAIQDSRDRLLTSDVFRDAAIHFGAEILVRTIGPFSGPGSPYADLPADHPDIQTAVSMAAHAIRTDDETAARHRFPLDFDPDSIPPQNML